MSFVYAMETLPGYIKVGWAKNSKTLKSRLSAPKTYLPEDPTVVAVWESAHDDTRDERGAHYALGGFNTTRRELFNIARARCVEIISDKLKREPVTLGIDEAAERIQLIEKLQSELCDKHLLRGAGSTSDRRASYANNNDASVWLRAKYEQEVRELTLLYGKPLMREVVDCNLMQYHRQMRQFDAYPFDDFNSLIERACVDTSIVGFMSSKWTVRRQDEWRDPDIHKKINGVFPLKFRLLRWKLCPCWHVKRSRRT